MRLRRFNAALQHPVRRLLILLVAIFSLQHIAEAVEVEIIGTSQAVEPTDLKVFESFRKSLSESERNELALESIRRPLLPEDILPRLATAATLRDNILSSIHRILLLKLDEESRISFERIYDVVQTRHSPTYDLLPILPIIHQKIPRQQLYSVLQILERIGTKYVSSYASLCKESLSDGRVNMELAIPTDLLSGIENRTVASLAMDSERKTEVPLTLDDALKMVTDALTSNRMEMDLYVSAVLMLNLPNFDLTNPEVPDSIRFVAEYMMDHSKRNDPLLEYIGPNRMERVDRLVKTVLERMEVAELPSSALRESISMLLQNFDTNRQRTPIHNDNAKTLFDIVVSDFYPKSIVAIAKYLQDNFDRLVASAIDVSPYETRTQALLAVITRVYKRADLPTFLKESSLALFSFVAQKQREEEPLASPAVISFYDVLEYLDAFRTPCASEKLREAEKALRQLLTNDLPWNFAFGDKRSGGSPRELLVAALINLRNTHTSKELALAMDDFIYQAQTSGSAGKPSILYELGIIFQREDSTEVELDLYSLLARVPNVFKDERFTPLITFLAKPNILDYLGHEFNKFAYNKPRELLLALLKRAIAIPAISTDKNLLKALKVGRISLEEPTLVNKYTAEELQSILKLLPGIENDPRYLPLKLLFKKENLFKYISPSFSLAGLKSPIEKIAIILNTVSLKPIHSRLSESIKFALSNIEGPPLPARSFNREDFVYLVNQLFSHNKKLELAILKSVVHKRIDDWNIAVGGTAENVLARALSYPTVALARHPELLRIVEEAEKFLEEPSWQEVELLRKKTLNGMLDYLPDNANFRPVNLLLKKANLAMFIPKLNVTTLNNEHPREALITLLENLSSSEHIRAEKLLLRRITTALHSVRKLKDPPSHEISSHITEALINPLDAKYKPLWQEFKRINNETIGSNGATLEDTLLFIQEKATDGKVKQAATMALQEIFYGVDSGLIPIIEEQDILGALSLLPNRQEVVPLKRLLTPSWILDVLPKGFQISDYASNDQLLRAILYLTKQRTLVANNPLLMNALFIAEKALGGWEANVEPLKEIVTAVKNAVYEPVKELLAASNLNRMRIHFSVDPGHSPRQSLVSLLHRLMLHPNVKKDTKVLLLLDAVKQDVVNFGVDLDLISVLDNAGVPYTPDQSLLRLFLHRNQISNALGPLVFKTTNLKQQLDILLELLRMHPEVNEDKDLLDAVESLGKIEPGFTKPIGATVSDLMDFTNTIPLYVLEKYPDVRQLFSSETLEQLTKDDEIIASPQPLTTLLVKMAYLPSIMNNFTLSTRVIDLYKELDSLAGEPLMTGFQLRPLLRELQHVQQHNIDYVNRLLNPKILSVLLPDNPESSNDVTDFLRTIIRKILSQPVVKSHEELKSQLSSVQRDLELIAGPVNGNDRGLSEKDLKEMLALIPNVEIYEPIRYLIETDGIFEHMPNTINWKNFPTPQKKLMEILLLIEDHARHDDHLYQSVRGLNLYLVEKFYFITEGDIEKMRGVLGEFSAEYDLVPLKIFLTIENLIKYMPRSFSYKKFHSPKKALASVLDVLSGHSKLKRRIELQNSINDVRKILANDSYETEVSVRKVLSPAVLTMDDLRFVLTFDIKNPELENFVNPKTLIEILPKDFSFSQQPTFKAKALHLLTHLVDIDPNLQSKVVELLRTIESFPDVPKIADDSLDQLIEAIPTSGIPDMNLVTKYLKAMKLMKLLPGNFEMKNQTEVKGNLREVVRLLSYNIGKTDDRTKKAFASLLAELDKPESSVIPERPDVDANELKSLISEIPFKKVHRLHKLKKTLTQDQVMTKLPLNFDLEMYNTKKLRLLAVLEQVKAHPDDDNTSELLKLAEKLVNDMPDAPRISDIDVKKLLATLTLEPPDLDVLLHSCRVEVLAKYLPIEFDLKKMESYKKKITAIISSCRKNNFKDIEVKQALANVEVLMKMLPSVDLSKEEISRIFDEVTCGDFSRLKPLKNFLSQNNILPLLKPTVNLEAKDTVKQKFIELIKVLRNVKRFQNEQMFAALDVAEEAAHALPNKPSITEKDIATLKQLPVLKERKAHDFANALTLKNILKVVPATFDIEDYDTDESKITVLINHADNMAAVKLNDRVKESLKFVRNALKKEAEVEVLSLVESMIDEGDEYLPLKLQVLSKKRRFFKEIASIPHGYEYPKVEDRLRVVLKAIANIPRSMQSKSLGSAIDSLISKLSVGVATEYEVNAAIEEIGNSKKYLSLRSYLRCKDIRKQLKNLTLSADHSSKRLLLDILNTIMISIADSEIIKVAKRLVVDVQRSVWDSEAEEMFKQLPNFKDHVGRLEAVRSYYILLGPETILGEDYSARLPNKLERLKILSEKLHALPDLSARHDLKIGVEYLVQILMDGQGAVKEKARSSDEINIKALFAALPKTRNEVIILGILKFFSDPQLLRKLNLPKNPFDYKYKGPLLQAIIENGLDSESVQQDAQQQQALEFFRDKIVMTGPGAQPIELKNFARHSTMKVDLIGLLKAVDVQAVNVSVATKMATFFDTQYDSLIHGLGFDQAPYTTRGTYLKAFLEHLIESSSVAMDVKRYAKLMIPAIRFDGSGAEAVDINEEIIPDNRMFGDEYYPGYSPPYIAPMYILPPKTQLTQLAQLSDPPPAYLKEDLKEIFSHFQQPRSADKWNLPTEDRELLRVTPIHISSGVKSLSLSKLPYKVEAGRALIKASVNRILDPKSLVPATSQRRPHISSLYQTQLPITILQTENSSKALKSFTDRIKEYMRDHDEVERLDDEHELPEGILKRKQEELKDNIRRSLSIVSRALPQTVDMGTTFNVENRRTRGRSLGRRSERTKQASIGSATSAPGKANSKMIFMDLINKYVKDYDEDHLLDDKDQLPEDTRKRKQESKNKLRRNMSLVPRVLPETVDMGRTLGVGSRRAGGRSSGRRSEEIKNATNGNHTDDTTFSPEIVLFDLKDMQTQSPVSNSSDEGSDGYITEEEAEQRSTKKREPVKPLKVDPNELPEADPGDIMLFRSSNSSKSMNLENRKIFNRGDSLSEIQKIQSSDDISVEEFKKRENDGKTVKKDLDYSSKPIEIQNRMFSDKQPHEDNDEEKLVPASATSHDARLSEMKRNDEGNETADRIAFDNKNERPIEPVNRILGDEGNQESYTADSQSPMKIDKNERILEPKIPDKTDDDAESIVPVLRIETNVKTMPSKKKREISSGTKYNAEETGEEDGIPSLSPRAAPRNNISKRDAKYEKLEINNEGKEHRVEGLLDESHRRHFRPDLPSTMKMYGTVLRGKRSTTRKPERGVSRR